MALNTIVVAKHAGYAQAARRLRVKKTRHRLTRRVTKCSQLRANCANCKQTAPTTSHLGHRKATQFCRYTKSLDDFIYIFYILSACFKENENIIKIYNAVVVKGIV